MSSKGSNAVGVLLGIGFAAAAAGAVYLATDPSNSSAQKKKKKKRHKKARVPQKDGKSSISSRMFEAASQHYTNSSVVLDRKISGLEQLDGVTVLRIASFLAVQDCIACAPVHSSWQYLSETLCNSSGNGFFHRHALQGIPPALRAQIWFFLSGGHATSRAARAFNSDGNDNASGDMKDCSPHYHALVTHLSSGSETAHDIAKDVTRTFSQCPVGYDSAEEAEQALSRVLRSYASHDPEVGYVQSMNFVASFIISTDPTREEALFWTFNALMSSPNYGLRELYLPGLIGWKWFKHIFEAFVFLYLPELHQHFARQAFPTDALIEWFLTWFTHEKVPRDTAFRIMDMLVCDGVCALYRVGLAMLSYRKHQLLSMPHDSLFTTLKVFPNISTESLINLVETFSHVSNAQIAAMKVVAVDEIEKQKILMERIPIAQPI